jgi:glycosyltransferase involved in cell wall biosynthesis
MKIRLPHDSEKFQGGGTTFINNFKKAINKYGHEIVEGNDFDIYFIAGASLANRDEVIRAKEQGKIIILRVDNLLEDRKNRNTGMPRLKDFAELADVIVYQSEWAKRLLSPLIGNGIVIYNGVDTDIFYPRKELKNWDNIRIFYSKYSRNEVKQFHEVQYFVRDMKLSGMDTTMVLVGKYADDYLKIEHPFDFHNDESFEYLGVQFDNNKLADIIRGCDIAFLPYYADACSNTILEVQACGVPVIYCGYGGSKEIVDFGVQINHELSYKEMVELVLTKKYDKDFVEKRGLDRMGELYNALLQTIASKSFEI